LKGIAQNQNLKGWTEERWTELRATYYGMCARVDHQFGMILTALREKGIYDDSAIFFFSDHGDFTGDYGLVEKTQNTFEDCLTNVPFLVKPPSWIPCKARVSDALVELIDFPATVEDITGIRPNHDHFGRSLVPLIKGETEEHRDAVFCEGGRLHGEVQAMERELGGAKRRLYWPRLYFQHRDGGEHGKATMCRTKEHKYVMRLYEQDELYDLRADPQERVNRIDDDSLSEVKRGLKERLLHYYVETADVVPHDVDRRK
ncbi:MAG: sulfatase-like hydrolase/transferase, partial [Trueperaceae bacterium]